PGGIPISRPNPDSLNPPKGMSGSLPTWWFTPSGLQSPGDLGAARNVGRPHRGAESETSVVGAAHGIVHIAILQDRQHRPELHLFTRRMSSSASATMVCEMK